MFENGSSSVQCGDRSISKVTKIYGGPCTCVIWFGYLYQARKFIRTEKPKRERILKQEFLILKREGLVWFSKLSPDVLLIYNSSVLYLPTSKVGYMKQCGSNLVLRNQPKLYYTFISTYLLTLFETHVVMWSFD